MKFVFLIYHEEKTLDALPAKEMQTLVDGASHRLRKHGPVVVRRPRNVHEVRERRVGAFTPDEPRGEVEVVIVEEHGRLGLGL